MLKQAQNYGGEEGPLSPLPANRLHQQFGPLIASCDGADLRPMPNGVAIYGNSERRFEPIPAPIVPRKEVIDELYEAVFHGRPALHDGAWGMATMQVCLAILQSARTGQDIVLHRQVPIS